MDPGVAKQGGRLRATLWIGIALTSAIVVAQIAGGRWLRRLESGALDWRIRNVDIIPDAISPDIVHVDIDDQSLRRIGKWPWRRDRIAGMVDVLSAAGARVIVFDVMCEDPEDPRYQRRADGTFRLWSTDVELAVAMRRAGNVILAADAVPAADAPRRLSFEAEEAMPIVRSKCPSTEGGRPLGLPGRVIAPPRPIFAQVAERIGAVHLSIESSELSVHELPAWQSSADIAMPHLGVAAAAAYLGIAPTGLTPDPDRLVLHGSVTQLRQGIMLVPWAVRRGIYGAPWLAGAPLDTPEWLRVHRHVSAAPIVELGERQRAIREAVSFLLERPVTSAPTPDELQQADEEVRFLLTPYKGKDLAVERARLEESNNPEDSRAAATLSLIERFQSLRPLAASGGPDEKEIADIRAIFNGKVVFFGWIATGAAVDMHRTPLGARTPGVVVHAAVANGLLAGRSLSQAPWWADALATFAMGIGATLVASRRTPGRATAWCLALALGYVGANAVGLYDAFGIVLALAAPLVAAVMCWAACTTQRAILLRAEKAAIRRQFSSRVPAPLVDYLAEHPDMTNLDGEEREVTVLFTDFTGFAGASERMDGRSTVALLNTYLRALTDVLVAHGAYINKFLGDGVMCFWNAPVLVPDHATRACRAVVEAMEVISRLNRERESRGEVALPLRVGIATGRVIVGDCGAPPNLNDYTVIGDAVNLASRLESANKQMGTGVLLTRQTVDRLADDARGEFVLRPLGMIRVMGQSRGAEVWELVGRGPATPEQTEWVAMTTEAVSRFRAAEYAAAIEQWRDLVLAEHGQAGALMYVQRCHELMQSGRVDDVLPLREK